MGFRNREQYDDCSSEFYDGCRKRCDVICPTGPAGTSVIIRGSYPTYCDLVREHPVGINGEAYIVGGFLYIWYDNASKCGAWNNVGRISGDTGPTGATGAFYLHNPLLCYIIAKN